MEDNLKKGNVNQPDQHNNQKYIGTVKKNQPYLAVT
jgi:hypothetical protein